MRKIYKIPILGYIVRWIVVIVKLPKKFELLFHNQEVLLEKLNDENQRLQQRIEVQQQRIEEQQQRIEEQQQRIDDIRKAIAQDQKTILQSIDDIVELRGKALAHEKTILQSVEDIVDLRENSFDRMINDNSKLEKLNTELSIHPTIWGDKERLNISPLASVSSCTFNTNSGNITIGDYTFAGSNVSILAGSHDMHLSGLIRRDVEYHEGFDIKIGDGVWLASNSTILGPCEIGDNAVIAAGAVVTPGTIVKENEVYAGVPARNISDIEIENDSDTNSVRQAMERNNGVLFMSGWSEKRNIVLDNVVYVGHWIEADKSIILSNNDEIELLFVAESIVDELEVVVENRSGKNILSFNNKNTDTIKLDLADCETEEILIYNKASVGRLFVAVL